jgi:hypothetical protein
VLGKLVDAFLADHGGIHIGEKELLAPGGCALHHHVNQRAGKRPPRAIGKRMQTVVRSDKRNIRGHAGCEPIGLLPGR